MNINIQKIPVLVLIHLEMDKNNHNKNYETIEIISLYILTYYKYPHNICSQANAL